jgi:hypothetical protein
MSKRDEPRHSDPEAPYGAQTRRPRWPLVFLGLLYLAWLLVMVWMAAYHTGQ